MKLKFIHLFSLIVFVSFNAWSTDEVPELTSDPDDNVFYKFMVLDSVEYSLSSPYHTVHTLLENLEEGDFHPKVASQVFPRSKFSLKDRMRLAVELKLIFSRKGIYLNGEDFPMQKDYLDPATKTHRYVISDKLKGIYLERSTNGNWLFSRYSTSQVSELFHETFPSFTSDIVLYTMSFKDVKERYLGLKVWQWTGIAILWIVSYLIYFIGKWLIKMVLKRSFSHLNEFELNALIFPKLRKPLVFTLIILMWYFVLPFLLLPNAITYIILVVLKFILSLCILIFLFHFADLLVIRLGLYSNKTKRVDLNLLPVLKVVVKISLVVAGILFCLSMFGYDITNLLTGISFGGIALAFAAQDTIKNFFGSIMIFADKPFIVGDWVAIESKEGVVEEIGFRTTRIRTFSNSLLNIPNGNIVTSDVDNYGKREFRRFNTFLSIPYTTSPELIMEFIDKINKVIDSKDEIRKDFHEVRLNKISDTSYDILLYIFFITDNWSDELRAREELLLEVIKIANELEIDFAYPTRTILTDKKNKSEALDLVSEKRKTVFE